MARILLCCWVVFLFVSNSNTEKIDEEIGYAKLLANAFNVIQYGKQEPDQKMDSFDGNEMMEILKIFNSNRLRQLANIIIGEFVDDTTRDVYESYDAPFGSSVPGANGTIQFNKTTVSLNPCAVNAGDSLDKRNNGGDGNCTESTTTSGSSTSDTILLLIKAFWAINQKCRSDLFSIVTANMTKDKWARDILDATGKIPSGIQNGHVLFWGDYDQCIEIKAKPKDAKEVQFTGQYCTAEAYILNLKQFGNPATLRLGLCIPSRCKESEIKEFLKTITYPLSQKQLYPAKFTCQDQDLPLDTKAVAAVVICGIFATVICFATLYDTYVTLFKPQNEEKKTPGNNKLKDNIEPKLSLNEKQQIENEYVNMKNDINGGPPASEGNGQLTHIEIITKGFPEKKYEVGEKDSSDAKVKTGSAKPESSKFEKLVLSFSAYSNAKKILNTRQGAGALTAINGIRFLSMSWVILGHTLVFLFGIIGNIMYFAPKFIKRTSFQAVMNALVSVDSFFALSGLLVSYLLLREMKKMKGPRNINWIMYYFHRIWRLTPVYMIFLFIYFSLVPHLTNGPTYVQTERSGCGKYWWTNLLYINNFVYPDDNAQLGCIPWSWYLANDMQFYVLSPLLIVPYFINVIAGVVSTVIFLAVTWGATAYLAATNEWPPSLYGGGVNTKNMGSMFNDYYIVPWCRMGPYIAGVVTGYILYRTKCTCKINRYVNLLLWAVFTTLACLVLYGLHDAFNGDPLNQPTSSLYLTTHRTVWGACVCWVVFACATGNGGIINSFLSWSAFVPLSRLTYCAYLVHPMVMEIYTGSVRRPLDMTDLNYIFLFLGFLVTSLSCAFILSIAFESPMMGIEKVLLRPKKKNKNTD